MYREESEYRVGFHESFFGRQRAIDLTSPHCRRRKRVSIAEALLSASPLQCWDNSTRGLDAANAVEFCETILFLLRVLLLTLIVNVFSTR